MRTSAERRFIRITGLAVLAASAGMALAQPATKSQPSHQATKAGGAAGGTEESTPLKSLKDFIHFVKIRRMDVAAGYARQLFDAGLSNKDFVKLVEESGEQARFDEAVQIALKDPELESSAARLLSSFDKGKLERARDPDEITRSIGALTGTVRGRLLARERLKAASEYALPQLLAALLDGTNKSRQAEVRTLLIELGRASEIPLSTAMMRLDASQQEAVVDVLGLIPYKTSLPYLVDLKETTANDAVRNACERAIAQAGGAAPDRAALYLQLAEGYYDERSDLTSFPGEDHQLLWSYNPGVGLVMTAIRTPVFHEAMAMRLSERSLALRAESQAAVALWIAANFKRELSTPEGYTNPAYGAERREAMYYAVAAGSEIEQAVLARALETADTPLARKAIAALQKSAGGATLWNTGAKPGRKPLTEALNYPNRRVQYDAALALAAAQPREAFAGSERVVPTLASSIREASSRVAMVLASDNETYGSVRKILEKAKFSVLPFGRTFADMAGSLAEATAVDLVVIASQQTEAVPGLIDQVRGTAKISATPVMALTSAEAYTELRRKYERDTTVSIRQSALAEATVLRAIDELIQVASGGPVTEAEAKDYSARSLSALRDLAVSSNPVFDVGDAALPLMAALGEARGNVRLEVAEVLSRIGQERAQTALMDAALSAGGNERIALLGKVADSAKRFGNLLPSRQVTELVKLASGGSDAEATGAAALMGALNLPNSQLIPLIMGEKGGERRQ